MDLKTYIRDIPDFPKPGILFRDLTPLLSEPRALAEVEAALAREWEASRPTAVAAIESRGFIFGTLLARRLGIPLLPVRKAGKLPWHRISESYALEYGEGVLEVHQDAAGPGDRVVVVDDLLATGGTAAAACRLIERLDAAVVGCAFVVELAFLSGRDRLNGRRVESLVVYPGD